MNSEVLLGKMMPPSQEFYLAQHTVLYLGDEFIPFEEYDSTTQKEVEKLHHTKKYLLNLKFETKSWQYAWRSTRCTKDTLHTFAVSVLSPEPVPLPYNQTSQETMNINNHSSSSSSSSSRSSSGISGLTSFPSETAPHLQLGGPETGKILYKVYQSCCEKFTVSCVRRSEKVKVAKQAGRSSSVKGIEQLERLVKKGRSASPEYIILPPSVASKRQRLSQLLSESKRSEQEDDVDEEDERVEDADEGAEIGGYHLDRAVAADSERERSLQQQQQHEQLQEQLLEERDEQTLILQPNPYRHLRQQGHHNRHQMQQQPQQQISIEEDFEGLKKARDAIFGPPHRP